MAPVRSRTAFIADLTEAYVATASDVQIVKAGKKMFGLPVNYAPVSIATNGKQVAVGAEDGKLYIYESSGSALDFKSTVSANRSAVSALAYSPDGSLLAAGEASGKVLLLDAASASFEVKTSRWAYHTGRILALAWSPDGAHVASAALDTHIYVWSVAAPIKKVAIKVCRTSDDGAEVSERASGRGDERGLDRRLDARQRWRRRHDPAPCCDARRLAVHRSCTERSDTGLRHAGLGPANFGVVRRIGLRLVDELDRLVPQLAELAFEAEPVQSAAVSVYFAHSLASFVVDGVPRSKRSRKP